MDYFKNIDEGYVFSVSVGKGQTAISKSEYDELIALIYSKPTAPEGYAYKLNAETLEWELVEIPPVPEPEPDAEELLNILTGGDAE